MTSELQHIQKDFHLPDEKYNFSIKEIYDCPELQRRHALSTKISSQINQMEEQIRETKKSCKRLMRHEPRPVPVRNSTKLQNITQEAGSRLYISA